MKIGTENEKLEFKKTTAEDKEGVISMAAILNKHGGGELYFGVLNDGTPKGQMVGEDTLRQISRTIHNHFEPKVYPKIELVYINDKPCIHVAFTGENAPYFAYGRAYIRFADEDRVMAPTELEAFFLRKSAGRDKWDSELSGKTISHVDESILKQYVEQANSAERIDFSFTGTKDTLDRLYVTNGEALTNAACSMFIGMPLLEVQMAVFATKQKLTFLDIRRGSGNIRQLIEIAVKYIIDNTRWRVVLDGSLQRKEIPEVPIEAIREAVTNSFCHRDYRSSQNNEVAIYSNRIEIYNPGRFPDGQTPEDFISGKSRSIKRNPNIAQLLYYSKDIESFGTGLQRLVTACTEADVRVEFERSDLGFTVIFYRPVNHINVDDSIAEDITGNITGKITGNITENITENITGSITENIAGNITGSITGNIARNDFFNTDRQLDHLQNQGDTSMETTNKDVTEVTNSDNDELERVKAELAAIKQRFGLDKQEEFLKTHANITLKEFAAMLHGRDCQPNLTPDELLLAQQKGFVVVYGDSDDRVEFKGAIRAEGHTNPFAKDCPAGILALSADGELLDDDSELYAEYIRENRNVIKVFYCSKDGLNWVFESDIPHETFVTYDGGYDEEYADFDDGYARCMVFEASALR